MTHTPWGWSFAGASEETLAGSDAQTSHAEAGTPHTPSCCPSGERSSPFGPARSTASRGRSGVSSVSPGDERGGGRWSGLTNGGKPYVMQKSESSSSSSGTSLMTGAAFSSLMAFSISMACSLDAPALLECAFAIASATSSALDTGGGTLALPFLLECSFLPGSEPSFLFESKLTFLPAPESALLMALAASVAEPFELTSSGSVIVTRAFDFLRYFPSGVMMMAGSCGSFCSMPRCELTLVMPDTSHAMPPFISLWRSSALTLLRSVDAILRASSSCREADNSSICFDMSLHFDSMSLMAGDSMSMSLPPSLDVKMILASSSVAAMRMRRVTSMLSSLRIVMSASLPLHPSTEYFLIMSR